MVPREQGEVGSRLEVVGVSVVERGQEVVILLVCEREAADSVP